MLMWVWELGHTSAFRALRARNVAFVVLARFAGEPNSWCGVGTKQYAHVSRAKCFFFCSLVRFAREQYDDVGAGTER